MHKSSEKKYYRLLLTAIIGFQFFNQCQHVFVRPALIGDLVHNLEDQMNSKPARGSQGSVKSSSIRLRNITDGKSPGYFVDKIEE